jgi:hypothetical protein
METDTTASSFQTYSYTANITRDAVEKLLARQEKLVKRFGKNLAPSVFLLMDDCMYDRAFMRDDCMRRLFMNGRHWNIFFMLTAQYCMDMLPYVRTNIDYVFVLRDNVRQNRENLYKAFFGVFPTFDQFCQVMDQCTENYECMVLDNTSKSNKISDCVFWYKAPIRRGFRCGSQSFWQYHQRHYNPTAANRPTQPTEQPKRRGQTIQVSKTR